MYDRHLKVKDYPDGKGICTNIKIPANKPIIEFRGKIYLEKDLPKDSSIFLQIGPDRFLAPTNAIDGVDFISHSCDPNCKLEVAGNRAILYSLYVIPLGAKLTVDYSTTSTDSQDNWSMNCNCGSPKCRKLISGHQYLSKEKQEDYKKRGLLPLFITNPNLFSKKW